MIFQVLYDYTTGKIFQAVRKNHNIPSEDFSVMDTDSVALYHNIEAHWIDPQDGFVKTRPEQNSSLDKISINSDGIEEATLSNLPIPCTLRIDGVDVAESSGSFTITSSVPKIFSIQVIAWPYKNKTLTLEAN